MGLTPLRPDDRFASRRVPKDGGSAAARARTHGLRCF